MALMGPYLAACALLVVAGVGKAARPGDTARAAAHVVGGGATGLAWVVRIGAGAEAALGVAGLVVADPVVAAMVAASYAGFAGFVVLALRRGGPLATCGCFGRPDTPPTVLHVVVDLGLAAAAAWVAVAASTTAGPAGWTAVAVAGQPWDGVPLVLAAAACAVVGGLSLTTWGRLAAARRLFGAAAARRLFGAGAAGRRFGDGTAG
ncbi:MAG TPA: MauE/DoxX family redox-associated membrane protein [Acidimicrobiales bacterium]|nr:MauE/DoxX family redox-associated membrane protein [Acidimicrobiales bacterium]